LAPRLLGVLGLDISARFGGIGGDPARLRLADCLVISPAIADKKVARITTTLPWGKLT